MAISVTIGGPKIEGLELMSPVVPEFDTTVRSLFRGNSDKLLKMKPFLAILSNHSDRTLVAYALKWEIARPAGRQITTEQHKYPDAVAPTAPRRGNEIRPGEQNIALMSIELNCGRWGEATKNFIFGSSPAGLKNTKTPKLSIRRSLADVRRIPSDPEEASC